MSPGAETGQTANSASGEPQPAIHAVSPQPPRCVLRASPDPARRRLTLQGEGFPSANHGLQFRRLADDACSIIFDLEVDWLSATQVTLDMARIADLLWPDRLVRLAVRLMDTTNANYRPLSGWSAPFTLADDAAACGMPEVAPAGVRELPPVADQSWGDLLRRLAPLGFFRYAEPGVPAALAAGLPAPGSFSDLCVALTEYPTRRAWSADAEDLAEGGVVRWLERLAPCFARQGIAVAATQAWEPAAPEYVVTVNGRTFTIYSAATASLLGAWVAAAINALALVETLLIEGGATERVYAPRREFGGNGSLMLLLTPALAEAINASALVSREERLLTVRELRAWLG